MDLFFRLAFGFLLTLGIICLWAVPALIQTHGEFFRVGIGRHVVGRSIGAMEGHGANSFGFYLLLLPFYFVSVFISFFPWSLRLPWLIRRLRESRVPIDRYLIAGIVTVVGVFTLVATKLPHYILPALPLLSILLARQWFAAPGRPAALNEQNRACRTFNVIAIATAFGWIVVALIVPPLTARFFPSYALFRESRDYLRPEMALGSDYVEPSIVWYFRSRVKGFLVPLKGNRVPEFMSKPGPRVVILGDQERVVMTGVDWRHFKASGFNIPKGKKADLTLLLKSSD